MPGILDEVLETMSNPAPAAEPKATIDQMPESVPGKKKMFSYSSAWKEAYGDRTSDLGD
jgi:hypothetical protein